MLKKIHSVFFKRHYKKYHTKSSKRRYQQ